jgi:hypothetical protein
MAEALQIICEKMDDNSDLLVENIHNNNKINSKSKSSLNQGAFDASRSGRKNIDLGPNIFIDDNNNNNNFNNNNYNNNDKNGNNTSIKNTKEENSSSRSLSRINR